MKDSTKLQSKLYKILPKYPGLRLNLTVPPWSDREFYETSWVVEKYIQQSGEVINDDPLQEWLEEYQFFLSQKTSGPNNSSERASAH